MENSNEFEKEQKKFSSRYEEKERELLILTSDLGVGASLVVKSIWKPSLEVIAYIDLENNTLVENKININWLVAQKDRQGWIYNFEKLKVYKIKCRPCVDSKDYMLTELVDRNVYNEKLDNALKRYIKPVTISDDELGVFTLDKRFNIFENNIEWLGKKCLVSLEYDKKIDENAKKVLDILRNINSNINEYDEKFRNFAAEKLTSLANDWLEEGEERITKESFSKRIWINEISIRSDGSYSVYYNDDNIFLGHIIIIEGNIYSGLDYADIAG